MRNFCDVGSAMDRMLGVTLDSRESEYSRLERHRARIDKAVDDDQQHLRSAR